MSVCTGPASDADLLRVAAWAAADSSDDPDTQNGAVLSRPNDIVVSSANRFPAGVVKRAMRLERPAKYTFMEHAERNAIYAAAAAGWATKGASLHCLWFACPDCARAIIQAGIREVVGHVLPRHETPSRWLQAVQDGEQMLREGGVAMRWVAERLGVTIRFNGKDLEL